jgi:glycosyltransferase involved in cell wall biosynthesis
LKDQVSRKSAIITVTYNKVPDLAIFLKAAPLVDHIIICDNSSDQKVIGYLTEFCKGNAKFVLLQNQANLGISKAYNKAVAYAQKLGVFWLYFFDDDANFDVAWLETARLSWLELEAKGVPVGLLAPIISNDSKYLRSTLGMRSRYSVISSAITSGLFTNVEAFGSCGGYNPEYFVDWADLELCLRIRRCGRLVVRLNEVFVFQAFGRNLLNCNLRNKLINLYIKSSSILSLRLNKSNTLSTSYSVYSVSRYQDQKKNALWSMEHSGIRNLGFRLILIMIHHVVLPKILQKEVLYPNRG